MRFGKRKQDVFDKLEQFITGEMSPKDAAEMAVVASQSDEVSDAVSRLKSSVALVRADQGNLPVTEHLSANELATYIAGESTGPERARREAHLAHCDDCRAVFVHATRAYRRYLEETTGRSRTIAAIRRWLEPALLALVPGTCLGLYVLGYLLTPYDPHWIVGITNSYWVQIIGVGSAAYAVYVLSRNRF